MRRLQLVVLLRQDGNSFPAIHAVLGEPAAGRPGTAIAAAEQRLKDPAEASRHCTEATAVFWGYVQEEELR